MVLQNSIIMELYWKTICRMNTNHHVLVEKQHLSSTISSKEGFKHIKLKGETRKKY